MKTVIMGGNSLLGSPTQNQQSLVLFARLTLASLEPVFVARAKHSSFPIYRKALVPHHVTCTCGAGLFMAAEVWSFIVLYGQ
jgi:hypothetical protein